MIKTKLVNIFLNPVTINLEKNNEIIIWINEQLNNQMLDFHNMLDKLHESIKNGDKEKSLIWAYYITNIILKNNQFDDYDRTEIISDIRLEIDDMN